MHCWEEVWIVKNMFDSQKLLNMHTKLQHNNYRYVCTHDNCSYSSGAKEDVKKHMVKHGAPKLLCTFCGKGFHFKSELNTHLKVHSDEMNYKCSFAQCTCAYKSQDELTQHETIIHI